MPLGRVYARSTSIAARGVAIRSTGMSCVGDGRFSRRIWSRVHGGGDSGLLRHHPGLGQQRVLEVGEPAALADPRALEVDRHRPAQDQVELGHLLDVDHLAVPQRALDRRRLAELLLGQLGGVEQPEGVRRRAGAGTAMIKLLPCSSASRRDMRLRGVRVGLDRLGLLPGGMARRGARPRRGRWRSSGSAPARPGSATRPPAPSPFQTERRIASLDLSLPRFAFSRGGTAHPIHASRKHLPRTRCDRSTRMPAAGGYSSPGSPPTGAGGLRRRSSAIPAST